MITHNRKKIAQKNTCHTKFILVSFESMGVWLHFHHCLCGPNTHQYKIYCRTTSWLDVFFPSYHVHHM